MRPRLRFLADLLGGLVGVARRRRSGLRPRPDATPQERGDVEEVRRRLDETRERLKRENPEKPEFP